MKFIMIIIFAYITAFSAMSAPILSHADILVEKNIEHKAEKTDLLDLDDHTDELALSDISSFDLPFLKNLSPQHLLSHHKDDISFVTLQPPDFLFYA